MKCLLPPRARLRFSNHPLPGLLSCRWRAHSWLCAAALATLGLTPHTRALTPTPMGGYPGFNTVLGDEAAAHLDTMQGEYNTACGYQAFANSVGGDFNTANGAYTLTADTTGSNNTANGVYALSGNTTGNFNTATGFNALAGNSTGGYNTANGTVALTENTTGSFNTADGMYTLGINSTGSGNTATGYQSMQANINGQQNTALGYQTLYHNYSGSYNVAIGLAAGASLTTGNNNVVIANAGVVGESGSIRVGTTGRQTNTYVAGIVSYTSASGVPVVVDPDGHLGVKSSSERFKEAIRPMQASSEAILALEPVAFHYKPEFDPQGVPQFGLIAEQVAKVDPDLVARDAQGKVFTVRYDQVNAMLLNEFLKEHRKVEAQQGTIEQLRAGLEAQQKASQAQQKALQADLEAQRQELRDLAALIHARPAPPAP